MSWQSPVDFKQAASGDLLVTGWTPVKGSPDRIHLEVEGDVCLECQRSIARSARAVEGAPVSVELLSMIERADKSFRAYQKALELLSYRARSRRELEVRLHQEVDDRGIVDGVLAQLEAQGYIDDEEFARMFIRDRIHLKPRGPYKIASELYEKGIDRSMTERLFQEELEEMGTSERALARQVAQKWLDGRGRRKEGEDFWNYRKRLLSKLARSGFNGSISRSVAQDLLEHPE